MKVKVNTAPVSQVVSVGIQGPAGISNISAASDVDTTNLNDGSLLVYKTATNKWTSTVLLNQQIMEGGEF